MLSRHSEIAKEGDRPILLLGEFSVPGRSKLSNNNKVNFVTYIPVRGGETRSEIKG